MKKWRPRGLSGFLSGLGSHDLDPRASVFCGGFLVLVLSCVQTVSLFYWLLGLTVSIPGLERALQQYTLEPSEKPFDLKSVPLATTPMAEQRTGT